MKCECVLEIEWRNIMSVEEITIIPSSIVYMNKFHIKNE